MVSSILESLPVRAATRQLAAREQHDLSFVAAVHLRDRPFVLQLSPAQLRTQIASLGLEPGYPPLEVEHLLDPGEVHPHLLGQLLDVAPELDVLLRVQPRVLYALSRAEQALLLVHPQGLRVHPDQLRGDPDHEHRPLAKIHDPTFLKSSPLTSSSLSSARVSSISRSRFLSFLGTTSRVRTMRSPRSPLRARALGAPAPRTLNCLPSWVPAGNRNLTAPPPSRGTSIPAPSAASTKLTGTSTTKSSPRRLKTGCSATRVTTKRSPAAPPLLPALPLPGTRIFIPSFAPAGILTVTCRALRNLPLPEHVRHGFSTIVPSPPHLTQGSENAKNPWSRLLTPRPPPSGQVRGAVPGAAPVPRQSPQASSTGTLTRVVAPLRASLNFKLTLTVMSSPLSVASPLRVARPKMSPRPPKPSKRSERSSTR